MVLNIYSLFLMGVSLVISTSNTALRDIVTQVFPHLVELVPSNMFA